MGEFDELSAFGARGCQGLLAENMLAGLQSFKGNGCVLGIGCAHMDGIDGRIIENSSIVGFDAFDTVSRGETLSSFETASSNCHNVDRSDSADGFEMDASHKSCTDNGST